VNGKVMASERGKHPFY